MMLGVYSDSIESVSELWCGSMLTGGQATLRKLLIYCVLSPTQPPALIGTGKILVVAYGLRGQRLVWLIEALVCL